MNTQQALVEIDREAEQRKAAIVKADREAQAVIAANLLSEQQKAELQRQEEVRQSSRQHWAEETLPDLRDDFAVLIAQAEDLKAMQAEIERLFNAVCELHPTIGRQMSALASKIASERCTLPDVQQKLVDVEFAVTDAADDVIQSQFSVGINRLIADAIRNRLGIMGGISTDAIYQLVRAEGRDAAKRLSRSASPG